MVLGLTWESMSSPILMKPRFSLLFRGFFLIFFIAYFSLFPYSHRQFYYFRFEMNFQLKIISFFVFFSSSFAINAQELDSVQTNNEYKTILFNDKEFLDVLFYKHFNNMFINNLGTYGSSHYYATTYLTDNQSSIFAPIILKNRLLALNGFRPFTNVTWINAGRREQILSINHIQKFGRVADLHLYYKRISSPGSYINQEVNDNDLRSEFNFYTPNKLYQGKLFFNLRRLNNQENAGLNDVKDFTKDSIERRELFKVNINKSYYQTRTIDFGINQKLNLFSKEIDSTRNHTIFIGLNNHVSNTRREYFDFNSNSPIYDTTYFDTTFTQWKDSTHLNSFFNRFSLGFSNTSFTIEPYIRYKSFKYHQYLGIDTLFSSSYVGSSFLYKNSQLDLQTDFNYGINGYNQNDVNAYLTANYTKQDKYELKLQVLFQLNEPDVYFKTFSSNHFKWENYRFTKQQQTYIGSEFYIDSWDLKLMANAKLLYNLIYFDTLAMPAQQKQNETISTFMVEKGYRLKNVHFRTALLYQLTSDRYILPMPNIVARQIIYYENRIFKKAMKIRVGANVTYSTKYYAQAFMPSISQFYAQNTTKIGDYPFVDFFLSTHLKRAQIFFKWEHLNAGFSGLTYLTTPTTPFLDRSFKFGVSWNMFD